MNFSEFKKIFQKNFAEQTIVKLIFKVAILTILTIASSILLNSPVFTNDIAMGQMSNSDGAFIAYRLYQAALPIIEDVCTIIRLLISFWIGADIYKMVNHIKENRKK